MYGKGRSYRGQLSVSMGGHTCANWNTVVDVFASAFYGTGVGRHNYCRNPDGKAAPWCWVMRRHKLAREYCDIPRCDSFKPTTTATTTTTTTSAPTTTTEASVSADKDTEFTCGERVEVKPNLKIVGGARSQVSTHPWVASIFYRKQFLCGGSLIAPCWVLTAAHCFHDITDARKMARITVYLGKNAINETDPTTEQSFRVRQLINHHGYHGAQTGSDFNNDIALLQIVGNNGECAYRTETARTVCLPPAFTTLPAGFFCTIAGYGRDRTRGQYTRYLHEGQVRLRAQDKCVKEAPEPSKVTENMFCAASPDWETDSCQGDSGGPLVCEVDGRMFLFGIISYGEECAQRNQPGFYTRVTNYNKWIAQHTGLPDFTTGIMYPQK